MIDNLKQLIPPFIAHIHGYIPTVENLLHQTQSLAEVNTMAIRNISPPYIIIRHLTPGRAKRWKEGMAHLMNQCLNQPPHPIPNVPTPHLLVIRLGRNINLNPPNRIDRHAPQQVCLDSPTADMNAPTQHAVEQRKVKVIEECCGNAPRRKPVDGIFSRNKGLEDPVECFCAAPGKGVGELVGLSEHIHGVGDCVYFQVRVDIIWIQEDG